VSKKYMMDPLSIFSKRDESSIEDLGAEKSKMNSLDPYQVKETQTSDYLMFNDKMKELRSNQLRALAGGKRGS